MIPIVLRITLPIQPVEMSAMELAQRIVDAVAVDNSVDLFALTSLT
jgi:hypothetical protein